MHKYIVIISLSVLLSSCISFEFPFINSSKEDNSQTVQTNKADAEPINSQEEIVMETEVEPSSPSEENNPISDEIQNYITNAKNAIDSNHLAEGIKHYLSAMGRASKNGDSEIVESIKKEITTISSRLTVEPHESWLKSDGTQITGSTRNAAKSSGIMPTVYLYENYNYVKSTVPDVIIRFEFLSNSGTITGNVTTDSLGMANTNITDITRPGEDAVIRAYPVITSEGYSLALRNIFRDFVYDAGSEIICILSQEKIDLEYSSNSSLTDKLASLLKPFGKNITAYSKTTDPASFVSAMSGNFSYLSDIQKETNAQYIFLASSEINKPTQMVYQGKTYQIFNSTGKYSLKIITSEGNVVFAYVSENVKASGNSELSSINACQSEINKSLEKAIALQKDKIQKALNE